MGRAPEILVDRIPVNYLQTVQPEIAALLSAHGIGKIGERETVHFCGLASAAGTGAAFFLPRHAQQNSVKDLRVAGLTMRALARFGRDVESRKGVARGPTDNATLAALIADLAQDFRDNGIYSERSRYPSRNSGKPDWKRTISGETPFQTSSGVVVFPEIRTSKTLDSQKNPLALIQAAVLGEIVSMHAWWLEGVEARSAELRFFRKPAMPRFLWPAALRSLLPGLFATRPIFLANALIDYLEETSGHVGGNFVCGVEDFSTVWEHMLRRVLRGVEDNWNARLPKPGYVRKEDGVVEMSERGMQTDIIVRNGNHLEIIDAKYYGATGKGSVPGWPDIVKQLYYQMALEKVVTEETVSNCFAFPAGRGTAQPYSLARIYTSPEDPAPGFPEIGCRYLDIIDVLEAYSSNRKINLAV
jgi:hypothetical protein